MPSFCDPCNPLLSSQHTNMCLGPSWWTSSLEPWTASGLGPLGTSSGLTTSSLVSFPCPRLLMVDPTTSKPRSTETRAESPLPTMLQSIIELANLQQKSPRERVLCRK